MIRNGIGASIVIDGQEVAETEINGRTYAEVLPGKYKVRVIMPPGDAYSVEVNVDGQRAYRGVVNCKAESGPAQNDLGNWVKDGKPGRTLVFLPLADSDASEEDAGRIEVTFHQSIEIQSPVATRASDGTRSRATDMASGEGDDEVATKIVNLGRKYRLGDHVDTFVLRYASAAFIQRLSSVQTAIE